MSVAVLGRRRRRATGGAVLLHTFTADDSDTEIPAADTGQATEALGSSVWGIASNQAKYVSGATDNNKYVVWDSGISNGSVEVTWVVVAGVGAGEIRMVFRCSDIDNLFIVTHSTNLDLYRRESGSYTSIGSAAAVTPPNGSVIRVRLNGSSIAVDVDGEEQITATDSFNASATKVGLGLFQSNTSARWDTLRVTT